MANLNITHGQLARDAAGNQTQAMQHPPLLVENIPFTATAGNSADFPTRRLIRIVADADCYYLVGVGATVIGNGGSWLKSGVVETISVPKGARISAVTA